MREIHQIHYIRNKISIKFGKYPLEEFQVNCKNYIEINILKIRGLFEGIPRFGYAGIQITFGELPISTNSAYRVPFPLLFLLVL